MKQRSVVWKQAGTAKRIAFGLLLSLCAILLSVTTAIADDGASEYSELKSRFTINLYSSDLHCTVGGKSTMTGAVVIPAKIIVRKGDGVSMPSGVTSQTYTVTEVVSFSNQTGITSVTFPEGLQKINDSAFLGCTGLSGDLIIPDSVTYLGSQAFRGCTGFTGSLKLGSGINTIKSAAFRDCGFPGALTIPDNITNIENYAFQGSRFTGTLTIPVNVTTIGYDAFKDCTGFTGTLVLPATAVNRSGRTSWGCTGFTGLRIEDGVSSIKEGEFEGCSGMTGSLSLSDSVTAVGSSAFLNCGFTGDIMLSKNLASVGRNAFVCPHAEGTLTIPAKIVSLSDNSFYYNVNGSVYDGMTNVTRIVNAANTISLCDGFIRRNDSESYFLKEGTTDRFYKDDYITEGTYIRNGAVKLLAAIITAPAAKGLIYTGAAQELVTAGSASGGTMQYALGTNAATAPADNLYTTSIPTKTNAGIYYIWYKVAGDKNHSDTDPFIIKAEIAKAGLSLKVSIKDWIEGDEASKPELTGNTGDGKATYSYKLKEQADSTYSTAVPSAAGRYTVKAVVPETANYKAGTVTVDFTIAKKPDESKSDESSSGEEPAAPEEAAKAVVKGKTYTVKTLKYKVTNADMKGKGTVTLTGTTKKKSKLTKLNVPKTVKIGDAVFKVTAIGNKAFNKFTKIKTVTIGDNVKTIGTSAFAGNTKLTKVTIGKSVTKVGKSAFSGDKKLKNITVKSTKLKSVGKNAIKGIYKKARIKVPKKQLKKYKKLFSAKTGFKKGMRLKK